MFKNNWGMLGSIVLAFIVAFLIVGIIVSAGIKSDKSECYARTANIGLPSRWSLQGGCQVEISEGRWVPLDNWYYIEKR